MSHRILVFYGSYRSDRMGIRLARFAVEGLRWRGDDVAPVVHREGPEPEFFTIRR